MNTIRITLAQINPKVGDLENNFLLAQNAMQVAIRDHANLVVFPELSVTGYPPKDLLSIPAFVEACKEYNKKWAALSVDAPAILFGGIHEIEDEGNALHNTAILAQDGRIVDRQAKTLLPTYDVFDEQRYFSPADHQLCLNLNGVRLGVSICEDFWNDRTFWKSRHYKIDPIEKLVKDSPHILINISASPFALGKAEVRRKMLRHIARRHQLPVVYVNQIGGNDDVIYDGRSLVLDATGEDGFQLPAFKECIFTVEVNADNDVVAEDGEAFLVREENESEEIFNALVLGLKDYAHKCGFTKAVLGLSGGIDSAIVAVLAACALGPKNVLGVSMPSRFSSEGSKDDALLLANAIGINYTTIPIEPMHSAFLEQLKPEFFGCQEDVTEENLQARIRGTTLMALSNKFGYLLLSTGNKSEVAMGYCIDGDSIMTTDQGILTAKELFDKFPTSLIATSIAGNQINAAHCSKKKTRVTIQTKIGTMIRMSDDHEIKVLDLKTGKPEFKNGRQIQVGDLVSVALGRNVWGDRTELPEFIYVKKDFDFKSATFKPARMLDFDMAKFIGMCVADGCYQGEGLYRIRSAKDETGIFADNWLRQTNLPLSSWKITQKDENGCYFIEISNVQFVTWLRFIGIKHGAHNKVVPNCIKQAPASVVKGFLSGVMMDSTTNSKHKMGEITYHSINEPLARIVHFLMLNLGIMSYFKTYKKPYLGQNKTLFEVYIPACESHKLMEGFDFMKPSIVQRIKQNQIGRNKFKSFADFIYRLEPELKELGQILGWKVGSGLRASLYHKTGKIGRASLKQYLEKVPVEKRGEPCIVALTLAVESTTRYIEIKSISTEAGDFEMFDFSMSDIPEYTANSHDVHNCTLYGDTNGGLAVISDVFKTKVFALARWINERIKPVIPEATISKPPSAELRPNQVDQDSLPPYDVLDDILARYVEDAKDVNAIAEETLFEKALIAKTIQTVYRNEYKRKQLPPGLRITKKAFGTGRQMPLAQGWPCKTS